jgi:enoyl-CoA hydratase/carnithine racemase
MSGEVQIERRGAVQWITINRKARRNAVNEAVITAIGGGIEQACADDAVRAIVLTGAGEKAFCAGADLQKNTQGGAFEVDYSRPRHYFVDLFKQMQTCPLPLVARVNGHVMAGGFGLLCACDMAVAADDIRFGTPESRVGLAPMMILPYMMRLIPPRRLQEMAITGEHFTAAEALEWGIVNYAVPRGELDQRLDWLLGRITNKSPTSIRLFKQAFNAMRDMSLNEGLEYAQAMVPVMSGTADAAEGISAFQEKRQPDWQGR